MTTSPTGPKMALALAGLDRESATTLHGAFAPWQAKAEEWAQRAAAIEVTSPDQQREMKLARESRLALREIRINVENARKQLKADSLKRGQAIDGIANAIKGLIEPIESRLLEQETFVERQEQARQVMCAAARSLELTRFGVEVPPTGLGAMGDDDWLRLLANATEAHKTRLEAAAAEEAARIEREKSTAKLRAENEKLRREIEAGKKAEQVKLAREREARETAERAARAAERKLAAAKAEEAARAAEAEEVRQLAEAVPDREKLLAFAEMLRGIPMPAMATAKGKDAIRMLRGNLEAVALAAEMAMPKSRARGPS